jgi:hypothetical protein
VPAPVVLLPLGYPCSSYEFRNLMPRLADRIDAVRWLLETHLDQVVALVRDFLGRVHASDAT